MVSQRTFQDTRSNEARLNSRYIRSNCSLQSVVEVIGGLGEYDEVGLLVVRDNTPMIFLRRVKIIREDEENIGYPNYLNVINNFRSALQCRLHEEAKLVTLSVHEDVPAFACARRSFGSLRHAGRWLITVRVMYARRFGRVFTLARCGSASVMRGRGRGRPVIRAMFSCLV